MTARPVAPVIPAASRGRLRRGKPGSGRPVPLASPPGRPAVVYGFGRIDASGRVAERAAIAALGCLYKRAVDDGLITEADDPARKVAKPRRLPTTRRALPDTRLAEINQIAATTGDDPELDTLLLRLHTETACRRGGTRSPRPRGGE